MILALVLIVILAITGGGLWLSNWQRLREERQILEGDWRYASANDVARKLFTEYLAGRLHVALLERAAKLTPPWFLPGMSLNTFICLDVAAGRYAEALQWRTRWKWKKRRLGFEDEVIRVNEAEALACLGRLDEALRHAPEKGDPRFPMLHAGAAAHRAWVLAELGRIEEARHEIAAHAHIVSALAHFEAEWHFSRFAIEFAARDWNAASLALDDAQRVAQRESSKRNLVFFRGRLAFARGEFEEAVRCFDAGSKSVYQWQGGPALLDWGDALAKLGRDVEAREAWRRCVTQDPQSPAAAVARGR